MLGVEFEKGSALILISIPEGEPFMGSYSRPNLIQFDSTDVTGIHIESGHPVPYDPLAKA